MKGKKLSLSEAANLPCIIGDDVIEKAAQDLRPLLEKHGFIGKLPKR